MYTVTKVIDGDTIQVNGLDSIRIAGIDAPELNQPFGMRAKAELIELLLGQGINILGLSKDKYGRTVGRIALVVGSVDPGLIMVQGGFAWVYTRYIANLGQDCSIYLSTQKEAISNRKGLWQEENPIPPWNWRKRRSQPKLLLNLPFIPRMWMPWNGY